MYIGSDDPSSERTIDWFKTQNLLQYLTIHNVDTHPLTNEQLYEIRYKLQIPTHLFTEPSFYEQENFITKSLDALAIELRDKIGAKGSRPSQLKLPICIHKKTKNGVVCRPPDRVKDMLFDVKRMINEKEYR